MENNILLKTENISKTFKAPGEKFKALENINFEIKQGQFVCIVGPSGCGKSTLLRLVSSLMPYDTGKITVSENTKFSFVFQNFALFPWLTVRENISFGLKMEGKDESDINKEISQRIEKIGLKGFENKHPKELSGGMKQRVGIARALAINPNLLILDEPFSALDTFTAKKLRDELIKIWKENNLTILMVSHLIEEAVELADKVMVFSSSPGTIKETIDTTLPRPRNVRSKEFFNLVDKISSLIG